MRKRIYLAGPITRGVLADNVNQATAAFVALAKAGLAPFAPQWSVYAKPCLPGWGPGQTVCLGTVNGNDDLNHADWLGLDLPWVAASDAVLRLPGESRGADIETECAADRGIPVFHSVADVIAWATAPEPVGVSKKVTLTTQYDPTLPEDQRFTRWTPTGNINVVIDNPAALEQLTPGKDFYVDLTPCG